MTKKIDYKARWRKRQKPVIYCMRDRRYPALLKIGKCSTGGKERLWDANTWTSDRSFELLWTLPDEGPVSNEKAVHAALAHHHWNGEWFNVSPDEAKSVAKEVIHGRSTEDAERCP